MDRWKHRRLMAWLSFVAIIAIVVASFFATNEMANVASIINTCIFILGSIIFGYLGLTTIDDKWHKQEPTKTNRSNNIRQNADRLKEYAEKKYGNTN